MHTIKTYNQISNRGLSRFSAKDYIVAGDAIGGDAILLRSHKLTIDEVGDARAVARAGAGTNNVPVADCTERGVVVFNTPGANANAVKELVLCGLLLASRGIIPGIAFAESQAHLSDHAELSKLMEQEKKRFAGSEIAGKTLGVIGLGAIGSLVAEMAIGLGMKVNGFDPALSVEAAWRLPSKVKRIENLSSLVANSDFITLHLPAIEATRGLINDEIFNAMRPGTSLINFARDEIVDAEALLRALDAEKLGRYVCDFPRHELMGRDDVI
ncbi:MAG: 3-phosphoglycerate dehydrogenase, partial [OM182 bacterium BACL3 MAG-120507-bin80]